MTHWPIFQRVVTRYAWPTMPCSSLMKLGDILTVTGYEDGAVSTAVKFTNRRLPEFEFETATWAFKQRTAEAQVACAGG